MRRILFLLFFSALAAAHAFAATGDPVEMPRAPWSKEAVDAFALLPVQDGGRVKPLDTFAQFRLLRMNGKRSLETPSGEKLGASAWLLDVFFYPDVARTYRMFQVRDGRVLDAIGVRVPDRKKSDRYSYDEIVPGAGKLFSEASRISAIEEKRRNGFDTQLFALAVNVRDFETLLHGLEFARCQLPTDTTPFLREVFGEQSTPGLTHFLAGLPRLREGLEARLDGLPQEEREVESRALEALSTRLQECEERSSAMAIFPPEDPKEEEWRFLGGANGAVETAFGGASGSTTAELIGAWETLDRTKDDRPAFQQGLEGLLGRLSGIAEARGEYSKVPMEVGFYRAKFFTRALAAFLLGFVLLAVSWLVPRARWPIAGVWLASGVGVLLVVAGVVVRCIIRERPPISTLYETILFVTGTGALVLCLVERFHRRGIALSLVPIWGAVGLFLSMKYELKEAATAGDTMPSLVAVLDTNFWLATHVTTITLGYAAGLVAAVLGKRWLLGKVFGHRRDDKEYYRSMTRMTYGVVCFGLIFSVVGTILGGVWANYSWGRFWGWDPKENGALLICIAELLILHLRMGGYIRDFGLAMMAVANGMVVAFSWFGVNLLGVGLHSYGFTAGIAAALYLYYGLCVAILGAGLVWRTASRQADAPAGGRDASALPSP